MIQLQIEVSGYCNAKCNFCPYATIKREKGFMSMDLYTKILDEASLSADKFAEVQLTGLGESLLDKCLEERLSYARKKLPASRRGIYTNGTLLTPERFDSLADAGLNYLVISLNAMSKEQRQKRMKLDDWDLVNRNIIYAFGGRHRVDLEIHGIASPGEMRGEEKVNFYNRFGDARDGGVGLLIEEGNWSGDNRDVRPDFDRTKCCSRAIRQLNIMWNGIVTTCCFDPYGKQVFGDLNKQTLQEVYASKEYVQFREDHWNDRADKHDICKGCNRI